MSETCDECGVKAIDEGEEMFARTNRSCYGWYLCKVCEARKKEAES